MRRGCLLEHSRCQISVGGRPGVASLLILGVARLIEERRDKLAHRGTRRRALGRRLKDHQPGGVVCRAAFILDKSALPPIIRQGDVKAPELKVRSTAADWGRNPSASSLLFALSVIGCRPETES